MPSYTPPEPDSVSPDIRIIEIVQAVYREKGLTLADPATARVHAAALQAVSLLVDATHAGGDLSDEQHHTLRWLMDAVRHVPDAL